jgi:hypothetical protein
VLEITSKRASELILERRAARRSLGAFCKYVRPNHIEAAHHKELCEALEALERRDIRRLVVEMPPRVGKSYNISEAFPAWFMGRNPGQNVIATSHGDSQARRFGRRVRAMVELRRYQSLFPGTRLDQRANASDEFLTQSGGMYLAVGINGSFMGQGAHLLIVDDPFRSRSDAESPTIRANVQSAYDDLETRLEPGGVVVVMHTRWHDDDLVGFIERTRIKTGREHWERITMPMIRNECSNWERYENDPDKATDHDRDAYDRELALWPERYDLEACRHRRRTIPRKTWVSLYQQKPHEEEGDFFRRDWLQMFNPGDIPTRTNTYITCDYGVTEGGDTTVFFVVQIDERGHWWVTDCWSGSEDAAVWTSALVDMVEEHNPDGVTGEAGVIRRAVEPFLTMMLDEARVVTVFHWAIRNKNKQACAVGLQGIASMRRLHIANTDWGKKLASDLRAFPTSADDHGVDALVNLGLCMEQTPGAFATQTEPQHNAGGRWERLFKKARGDGQNDWKTA